MIGTLLITIIIEGAVVIGYSLWKTKPVRPILFTSICGNLLTQSLLWIGLNLFFRNYLVTLLMAEILIWILESIFLYFIRPNHLKLTEATLLSLVMNGFSFGLGWFLPV
ncbi:MAG TPA: hypothetical protein VFQ23_03780 [Anaerolineales bacterium]|nr:hypothetical protein [Anaerolineales bacterium]